LYCVRVISYVCTAASLGERSASEGASLLGAGAGRQRPLALIAQSGSGRSLRGDGG
jgi:hypothetical protein